MWIRSVGWSVVVSRGSQRLLLLVVLNMAMAGCGEPKRTGNLALVEGRVLTSPDRPAPVTDVDVIIAVGKASIQGGQVEDIIVRTGDDGRFRARVFLGVRKEDADAAGSADPLRPVLNLTGEIEVTYRKAGRTFIDGPFAIRTGRTTRLPEVFFSQFNGE